ncbi:MAG: peptidylprolyl isomerase [Clostridia bacterium]|nr:peptidylprolyl isomerase [Clostridia bacterium]
MELSDFTETDKTTDYVRITVKNHGDIVLRLRSDIAPKTVKNFKKLVAEGFYDGLMFHRIMEGFMMQGGDPKGDGTGGSANKIKGEFLQNGVRNDLSHIKGVISMARGGQDMNSASCQFFICNADASASLDGKYAGFGYVVAGLETVDSASSVEVKENASGEISVPVTPVIIEKVTFVKKAA